MTLILQNKGTAVQGLFLSNKNVGWYIPLTQFSMYMYRIKLLIMCHFLSRLVFWHEPCKLKWFLRNKNKRTMFLASLGEWEMLWEHELTGECFHSFFVFFQTFTSVSTRQLDYKLEISTVWQLKRAMPSSTTAYRNREWKVMC